MGNRGVAVPLSRSIDQKEKEEKLSKLQKREPTMHSVHWSRWDVVPAGSSVRVVLALTD
jgi:hypothetical protein